MKRRRKKKHSTQSSGLVKYRDFVIDPSSFIEQNLYKYLEFNVPEGRVECVEKQRHSNRKKKVVWRSMN